MACGLPIVCYDHGGQTDFLVDGQTGHLVALNDFDGLTRALVNLHDHPSLRAAMAAHNRRLVEDYFIDKCADRYETLFQEVTRTFALARRGND